MCVDKDQSTKYILLPGRESMIYIHNYDRTLAIVQFYMINFTFAVIRSSYKLNYSKSAVFFTKILRRILRVKLQYRFFKFLHEY